APTIISHTPGSGDTNVDLFSNVSIKFSELLDPASVTPSTVHLRVNGNTTDIPVTITYSGSTIVIDPAGALSGSPTYRVLVSTGVTDNSGNPLAAAVNWTFTTGIGQWTQTAIADFQNGTLSGVSINSSGNGGLQLADQFRDDFNGSTLNTQNFSMSALVE